ncbi:MAG: TolC family protein [Acidobacteriota bacterium]
MKLRHLQASSCVLLTLVGTIPSAAAQQTGTYSSTSQTVPAQAFAGDSSSSPALPEAPQPNSPGPLFLRPTAHDYSHGKYGLPNPFRWYTPTYYPAPRLHNTPHLYDLLQDGKIYLSLSDAVTLALENNYDIAIARINLDIADTDLLRARAGGSLRGVSTGIIGNTLGTTGTAVAGGGGPGGTSSSAGGGGTGANGLVLSTNGGGPMPEVMDPSVTGQLEYNSNVQAQSNELFSGGLPSIYTNTGTFNFGYTQGFVTGSLLQVTFQNSRVTTNDPFVDYSPLVTSTFNAQITQHLLQGFGLDLNHRFIIQARNDRRITDSSFREQLLYSINQVEDIYWDMVSDYEDVQAKERALAQSTQLSEDNRKQLAIGTLAPLDVVNSDASVAADKQALISAQTKLEYQQLIMKQAIARNLNDARFSSAPIIPTDRVSLDRLSEEDMPVDDLVQEAEANNPQIEQAVLNMKNDEITIKAMKNGLLPTVDAYAFYGGMGLGGAQSAYAQNLLTGAGSYPPGTFPTVTYGATIESVFNNSSPNKGVGLNINIPLRNRVAQADAARSQMEMRQSEMRLQQLYTQIRMQIINDRYALTNDRAQVAAAQAQRDYAEQSFLAEQKKYRLGASTSANVLQQQRNLATAEDTLISDTATYAKDRAALFQVLSTTLQRYHISITDAAAGGVTSAPLIPGLTAPAPEMAPQPLSKNPPPPPQ